MKRYFYLLTMILAVAACVKPEVNPNNPDEPNPGENYTPDLSKYGSFKLNENVIFIDDKMDDFVEIDGQTMTIKGIKPSTKSEAMTGYPSNLVPANGSVVFIPLTDKYPEGFMGRVVSSSGSGSEMRFETEDVDLLDIFKELDINAEDIDFVSYLYALEDEDGTEYKLETAEDSVWDEMGGKDKDETDPKTKSTKGKDEKVSKSFEIRNSEVKGTIYLTASVSPHVYIKEGALKFNIATDVKSGFRYSMDFDLHGEIHLPLFKSKPIPIPVGNLLMFRPAVIFRSGLDIDGNATLNAEMNVLMTDERIVLSNESGEVKTTRTSNRKTPSVDLETFDLELDATVSPWLSAEFIYFFWKEEMLSVGISATAHLSTESKISFRKTEEKLLETNPEITFKPSLDLEGFVHCRLTKDSPKQRYTTPSLTINLHETKVPLLPQFSKLSAKKNGSSIKASGNMNRECYISSPEQGFALFKKGSKNPLQHKQCYMTASPKTKAGNESYDEVEFTGLAKPGDYEVKAYVVAEDGEHYYLPIESKVYVTKVTIQYDEYPEVLNLMYDDDNHMIGFKDIYGEIFFANDDFTGYSLNDSRTSFRIYDILRNDRGSITSMHYEMIALDIDYTFRYSGSLLMSYNNRNQLISMTCPYRTQSGSIYYDYKTTTRFTYNNDGVIERIDIMYNHPKEGEFYDVYILSGEGPENIYGQFDHTAANIIGSHGTYGIENIMMSFALSGDLGRYSTRLRSHVQASYSGHIENYTVNAILNEDGSIASETAFFHTTVTYSYKD